MPKIKSISFGRTFSDGDFEFSRIDVGVDLLPGEHPNTVFDELMKQVDRLRKRQLRKQKA